MQLIYFDRFVLKEMEMLAGTKCCRRVRERISIHGFTRGKESEANHRKLSPDN